MSTTTLTKSHVLSIFSEFTNGDAEGFFANVLDNVDWLVTGDKDSHPLAKRWHSKAQFREDSWARIGGIMKDPMKLSVVGVLVDAEERKAVVELEGKGKEYNNQYCWVVGFDKEGKISSVRAYLDTAKLGDALEGNE